MTDMYAQTAEMLTTSRVFELSHPIANDMPRYPSHPEPRIELFRRHGDRFRDNGASSASCRIVVGGHTGTHVDAIGHISFQGRLFDGTPVESAQTASGLVSGGVEELGPLIGRAVMLDIAGLHALDGLPGEHEVTPQDLDAAEARQGVSVRPDDVVLIRTGWGASWGKPEYLADASPGPGIDAARWLLERRVAVVGSDTAVFEQGPVRSAAPVHTALIWESGVPIIESLMLEELAAEAVYESLFIALPLPLAGATGSPIRPVALA